jgi:predicted ABC-type ATPase
MSVEAYLNEARGHDGEWVSGSATDAIESAVGRATGDAATHLVNTGIAPDTKTAHTNAKGEYSPERAKLHQAIIEHFMAGTQPHSKPEAIFTAGGAASGKSGLAGRADTVRNPGANLPVPRGHVYVNPDDIKQMLPEYDELSADGHSEIAAAATHEESSDIAKLLTAIAVKRQVGKFGDKVRAAKAAGYKVTARYAHIPVEEAIAREAARAQRTGRKVDEDVLRKQHQVVSQSFSQDVKDIPGINTEIYSTLGRGKPTLIASKPERGQMRVLKPSQYKQMIQKGSA